MFFSDATNSIAIQTQKLLKNTKIWKTPTLEIQDDKYNTHKQNPKN